MDSHRYKTLSALISDMRLGLNNVEEVINAENKSNTAAKTVEPYVIQLWLPQTAGGWTRSMDLPSTYDNVADAQAAIDKHLKEVNQINFLEYRVAKESWPKDGPAPTATTESTGPYIVQVLLPSGSWLHSGCVPARFATAAQAQQAIEEATQRLPGAMLTLRVFNDETNSPVGETGETSAEPYIVQAMFPGCSWVHSAYVPDSYATAAQAQQAIEEVRGMYTQQAPQLLKDTPVQQTGYVVEAQWQDDTIWFPSGNIGLAGTLFSSEYAARAAYKVLGSENVLYRAVRTTRPKPAQQWELRIQNRSLGWRKSVRTALAGTLFDTEYAAIRAAEKLGRSDVKYRAALA
jgi:hypothetical protein